jgi:type VI secretion system protein ImpK
MRDAEDLGETGALRKLIMYYLTQFEKNCAVIGLAPENIKSVKYALVAILDETVLSIPGEARNFWITNPMQLEIFGDSIAGEEFYNKLNGLLEKPDKNSDVLAVFYLCLSLGFQGKYLIGDPEERETIITSLARTLVKANKQLETLSPHAIRLTLSKKSLGVKRAAMIPLWVTGATMGTLAASIWIILFILSGMQANSVAGMF